MHRHRLSTELGILITLKEKLDIWYKKTLCYRYGTNWRDKSICLEDQNLNCLLVVVANGLIRFLQSKSFNYQQKKYCLEHFVIAGLIGPKKISFLEAWNKYKEKAANISHIDGEKTKRDETETIDQVAKVNDSWINQLITKCINELNFEKLMFNLLDEAIYDSYWGIVNHKYGEWYGFVKIDVDPQYYKKEKPLCQAFENISIISKTFRKVYGEGQSGLLGYEKDDFLKLASERPLQHNSFEFRTFASPQSQSNIFDCLWKKYQEIIQNENMTRRFFLFTDNVLKDICRDNIRRINTILEAMVNFDRLILECVKICAQNQSLADVSTNPVLI